MQLNYAEEKLQKLNHGLLEKFNDVFTKEKHVSSKFIGERRINSRPGSRISLFPSVKNNELVCLESNLELAHAIYLERDEDVLQYRTQAITIFLDEKKFIIPDFLIRTISGFEVHEIKPCIETIPKKTLARLDLAKDILSHYNIDYKIFDQKTLFSKNTIYLLNASYQRANSKAINQFELKKAEEVIKNKKIEDIFTLYKLMKAENIDPIIADHFVFYKNALGV